MRVRRRIVAAALALMMTSAPALSQEAPDEQVETVQTGLVGHVVLAARCPVPVGDEDGVCPSVPFPTTLTIRSADRSTDVAYVATDLAGAFAVQLDPGTYLVEAPSASGAHVARRASDRCTRRTNAAHDSGARRLSPFALSLCAPTAGWASQRRAVSSHRCVPPQSRPASTARAYLWEAPSLVSVEPTFESASGVYERVDRRLKTLR